jgi:hypothetical protein
MGLFQVLAEINGGEAEKLLADSLGMTQKGVEATFLDSLLHQMAPDQYKSLALSVAKDLLLNPSEESLKDYQHKTHLYSILTRHRDLDFAKDAQELLIESRRQARPFRPRLSHHSAQGRCRADARQGAR